MLKILENRSKEVAQSSQIWYNRIKPSEEARE